MADSGIDGTQRPMGVSGLRTTRVDSVASLLMGTLIILGSLVFLLFVVFLTQTLSFKAGDIVIEEERVAGRGDHAEGYERDIEPPGEEEVEELNETPLEDKLEALTDVATSVAAIELVDANATAATAGKGRGDNRPPGPLGEGDDIVPRYERWELKFAAKNVGTYATQLDYFKIELGCIGGKIPTVDYAAGLAGTPVRRSGASKDEKRLYFVWRQEGPLVAYDRQLLGKAGIPTQGRQLLKFIPKELEDTLARTEMLHAQKNGHTKVGDIAKTVFESQPSGSGYAFVVLEQRYRKGK
jgi:hypothetical protein